MNNLSPPAENCNFRSLQQSHKVFEVDDRADEPFSNNHKKGIQNTLPNDRAGKHVRDRDGKAN